MIGAAVPSNATLVAPPRLKQVTVTRVPTGPDCGFSSAIWGVTDVVIRLMMFSPKETNHSAPSGPAVIANGSVPVQYWVTLPVVVIRPILEPLVNHSAPSDPADGVRIVNGWIGETGAPPGQGVLAERAGCRRREP